MANADIRGESHTDGQATPVVGCRVGYVVVVYHNTVAYHAAVFGIICLMGLECIIAEKSGKDTIAADVVERASLHGYIACAAFKIDSR